VIGDGDFAAIEAKMKELAGKKEVFARREVPKAEAIKYFTEKGDEYKLELIDGLEDGRSASTAKATSPTCAVGPHLPDTSPIKAVKVLSVAGAYWRGDEKRKQLTRLYAITFPKQKELDEYLAVGRGQEARPPQAGQGTGPVHLQRAGGRGPAACGCRKARHCASGSSTS
jgi:threonyl-tRNA synthetase